MPAVGFCIGCKRIHIATEGFCETCGLRLYKVEGAPAEGGASVPQPAKRRDDFASSLPLQLFGGLGMLLLIVAAVGLVVGCLYLGVRFVRWAWDTPVKNVIP